MDPSPIKHNIENPNSVASIQVIYIIHTFFTYTALEFVKIMHICTLNKNKYKCIKIAKDMPIITS